MQLTRRTWHCKAFMSTIYCSSCVSESYIDKQVLSDLRGWVPTSNAKHLLAELI